MPRVDAARELFASLGGTLECFYFSFGVEDLLVICDLRASADRDNRNAPSPWPQFDRGQR
jgi:uncharacterized protein with GYD domain